MQIFYDRSVPMHVPPVPIQGSLVARQRKEKKSGTNGAISGSMSCANKWVNKHVLVSIEFITCLFFLLFQ
jgi:hypothetical protein